MDRQRAGRRTVAAKAPSALLRPLRLLIGMAARPKNRAMRSAFLIVLLAALSSQPLLAGGWGRHDERRPPPPPRFQAQRPPQPAFGGGQRPLAQPPPRQLPPPPQYRPLSGGEAAHRAQQLNGGGRVLAVDPADSGYRVRVLKDGEVRSVYVPGR